MSLFYFKSYLIFVTSFSYSTRNSELPMLIIRMFSLNVSRPVNIIKCPLSTSSLIRPSYTIRATIFEKVFQPENFLKTEYFPTKRIISLWSRTCKFSSRTCKLYFSLWIHFWNVTRSGQTSLGSTKNKAFSNILTALCRV